MAQDQTRSNFGYNVGDLCENTHIGAQTFGNYDEM